MIKKFVFDSKKATVTIVGAVLTMLVTVLPIFFPDIPAETFQQMADAILKIVVVYVGAQGLVDAATALKSK